MKKNVLLFLMLAVLLPACGGPASPPPAVPADSPAAVETGAPGKIYLCGEEHTNAKILEKELELWRGCYEAGMRHLFIEFGYCTGELLNLWMQAEDDTILDKVYQNWEGTLAQTPDRKNFYQKIKEQCPETVFHGTDVEHQYETTGSDYLGYLADNELEDSEQYRLAQESIEQGKTYYKNRETDEGYRENTMTENFIREYDQLNGENIMGIYGATHTDPEAVDDTGTVPCMANQLYAYYGDAVESEDLTYLSDTVELLREPLRVDRVEVAGKEYEASYFGKDETAFRDIAARDFWRLEHAYDDFKDAERSGDYLPYSNYPMEIEVGQVFLLEITWTDGSVARYYYLSEGNAKDGEMITDGFLPE